MIRRRILLAWETRAIVLQFALFKIAFLGKWDKRGERPFLWPVTSFPDCHIFCAFCPVPSLLLLWTVLLGPHQDLWLCDLLSDGWHEQPLIGFTFLVLAYPDSPEKGLLNTVFDAKSHT